MSNLVDRFKYRNADWNDFGALLNLKIEDFRPFFSLSERLKKEYFGTLLKIYIPNQKFPAISITGNSCQLNCAHCNKKYLEGMEPIITENGLYNFLINHYKNGGVGALISGGCTSDGSVPLQKFIDPIKRIKEETNLIINTHTGLIKHDIAKRLAEAGVDIVSFDINIDKEIIEDIYHLDKSIDDYKNSIKILHQNKLNIVPHICIGLYYGKLHKELETIRFLKELNIHPSLIVLIALIPPRKSMTKFRTPKPFDIAKIIFLMRYLFPKTELSLGCMRPRGKLKIEIEKLAIRAGITRIEIPSVKTLKWAKKNNPEIDFEYFHACCAIPNELEKRAKSNSTELTRYKKI
ncbi:MAG: radical SAM protein [Candidatus Lokiarchaeota archaeon]|nr:radical SAM protein [Candidatus Lokiarchaeota archaeon]MBD3201245.1 radical SAM protein [Candidatus Lokiarchaeota archaeon]